MCPVPSFLIESRSVIVKQSWRHTWSPFSRSLPSQRETTFVMDKHPENIQTKKRCTKATSGSFEATRPALALLPQRKVSILLQTSGEDTCPSSVSLFCSGWNCIQLAGMRFIHPWTSALPLSPFTLDPEAFHRG